MNLISVRTSSQQVIQDDEIQIDGMMAFVVENQGDNTFFIGFSSDNVTIPIDKKGSRTFEYSYPYQSSGKLHFNFPTQGKALVVLHQPVYRENI